MAAQVISLLLISGVFKDLPGDHWIHVVVGGAITVLTALGYTINRGKVKSTSNIINFIEPPPGEG